jgi:hypothetical protein
MFAESQTYEWVLWVAHVYAVRFEQVLLRRRSEYAVFELLQRCELVTACAAWDNVSDLDACSQCGMMNKFWVEIMRTYLCMCCVLNADLEIWAEHMQLHSQPVPCSWH